MDALKIWIAKFSVVLVWHFPNFPVLRNKEIFLKNFSQNSVKTALCGVVGSERIFKRVASTMLTLDSFPTSEICPASHGADGQIYGKGYPFPMLAPKLIT